MVHAFRRDVDQAVSQYEDDRMAHLEGWRVVNLCRLTLDCLGDFGPTVASIHAPQTSSPVEHLPAIRGSIMHVLCSNQHSRRLLELPVCGKRHPECAEI